MSKHNNYGVMSKPAGIELLFLIAAFIIISCGGGGGGGMSAGGGVSGTGRATGTITAFGSVFVNGIEFETTSDTLFNVNNMSDAGEMDLKVGMKVTVDAVGNVATSITYEPEVKGQVSNKNTDAFGVKSFNVLGQKVIVNQDTEYCFEDEHDSCNFAFADMNNGDFVEVSGFFDSDGNIIATMVKQEEFDLEEFEVKGTVSNLDTDNKTFSINSLTVDYSGVSGPPVIAEGDLVDIEGTLDGMGVLIASGMDVEDTQESPGQELELEGIVTQYTSQSDFEVNGQRVQTNDQTQFNGDPASIAVNVKVEVEGDVNSSGVLIANMVEIKDIDIDD